MISVRKYWVFDLDGTLVDSFPHFFTAMEEIFSRHGKRFTREHYQPILTQPLADFFIDHLGPESAGKAFAMLNERSLMHARQTSPFAGVLPLLQKLHWEGAKLAVWTSRDRISAQAVLESTGLDKLIVDFVSGSCVSRRKPDPEGLSRIIRRFGCAPEEVVMVGDHEHDAMAGKSVGATAVRASWHGHFEIPACSHADQQFRRVEEFTRWALGEISDNS